MKTLLLNAGYLFDDLTQIWSKSGYGGIAYSDGDAVETRIADIIAQAKDLAVLSSELPQYCTDWPTLYHLSNHRANILRPFEHLLTGAEILEIGAGCGAITRYLGECGARTLALEGSLRRAAIARSRVRDLSNVEVLAERFDDFAYDHKFDIVTLIGVLEYANLFSAGEEPAKAMLQRVHGLLKPGGKVIIAIENQFGLKYFAGAAEDHLGQPMVGIEDRYRRDQPRTWGRVQLESLLRNSGFRHCEFMAPFPDYKLPKSIVTEAGFRANDFDASAFAWQSVRADPQLPSLLNFSPELTWPGLFDNRLGLDLANSFLVVGSIQEFNDTAENVLAWHYTTGRRASFCKETRFAHCPERRIGVFLRRLGKDEEQPGDAPLVFVLQEESDYVLGTPLSREFVRIVTRDGWTMEEVAAWFKRYLAMVDAYVVSRTGQSSTETTTLPGFCFDLIPSNIICLPNGSYQIIDQEWEMRDEIPRAHLVFRSVLNLINLVTRFGRIVPDGSIIPSCFMTVLLRLLGFNGDAEYLEKWIDRELEIQEFVVGYPLIRDWLSKPLNDLNKDSQITNLILERDERDIHIANLDKELNAIKKSRSWRITSPLRSIAIWIRRFRDVAPLRLTKSVLNGDISVARFFFLICATMLPRSIKKWIKKIIKFDIRSSRQNFYAIQSIVDSRCKITRNPIICNPLCFNFLESMEIDISVVTFNSSKWINIFINSLTVQNYPLKLLNIYFVDNGSTDNTLELLHTAADSLRSGDAKVTIISNENKGFGAGHNIAIGMGKSAFCLVTNVDLTFEADSIEKIVSFALSDISTTAAWELRQKPYEHPKFYDPVTGMTNWNSHACVLLRRAAFEEIGGYDETIFMYGEDVELSYRLRNKGYVLKYCPSATVNHYSYEKTEEIKPLQYSGSIFANLYLRFKFGNWKDRFTGVFLLNGILVRKAPYRGAKRDICNNLIKLLKTVPKSLRYSRSLQSHFPFYGLDYEKPRLGAWYAVEKMPSLTPLVSVITRTYQGREALLRQAVLSVSQQTYPSVEHIIVEDGGNSMQSISQELLSVTRVEMKYISLGKMGRSAAGNAGLAASKGKWCVFLDDDDLLFGDHIEVLVHALNSNSHAVAAYSPAWEVQTDYSDWESGGRYQEISHQVPFALRQVFSADVLRQQNYMAIQSVLFERCLYLERGGFDEDMDALEDWILWNKYAAKNEFIYVEKVTSLYRVPADLVAQKRRQLAFDEALFPAKFRIDKFY